MALRNREKAKVNYKKGLWSPEEDQRLRDYIVKHGLSCWSLIPVRAGLQRNGKSCRLRWINYLRPGLKRGVFSREEEETVIKLQEKLGNKWSQIALHLPGRTDNEVKNYWNSYLKKEVMMKTKVSGPQALKHSAADCERSTKCKETSDQIISCVSDSVQSTTTIIESSLNEAVPKQLPTDLLTDWAPSNYANGRISLNSDDGMSKPWNCNSSCSKKVNWTDFSENYGQQTSNHISSGLHEITSTAGVISEQFTAVGHMPEEEFLSLISTGQYYENLSMSYDFGSCL